MSLKNINNITPNFRMDNGLWVEFNFNEHVEKLGDNLTNNRQLIIESMRNMQSVTIAQLANEIGISTTAIEKNINYLKRNYYLITHKAQLPFGGNISTETNNYGKVGLLP